MILVNFLNVGNSMEINLGLPEGTENDVYRYQQEKPEVQRMIESLNKPAQPVQKAPKIGRNDPCPSGSGLKYKNCKCSQYHAETK